MVRAVAERMSLLRRIEVRVLEEPVRLLRIVGEPEDLWRTALRWGEVQGCGAGEVRDRAPT
jgi:hypothetical protein